MSEPSRRTTPPGSRPRRWLAVYGAAIVINLLLCWAAVPFIAPIEPQRDAPLAPREAEAQLSQGFEADFTWSNRPGQAAGGSIRHTPFYRRAVVWGWRDGAEAAPYREQVLKVGWPFTTVRGFLRHDGEQATTTGAIPFGDPDSTTGAVRLFPYQLVWPGLVINSALLAAVLLGLGTLAGRRRGAQQERSS